MTLLNPPPNLFTLWSYFMTSILIIKVILMKGAILIQFQLWSYIFMIGFPLIKAISVKGAILMQSQLSCHQKLTLFTLLINIFTRTFHGILFESIQWSLMKVLVLKTNGS